MSEPRTTLADLQPGDRAEVLQLDGDLPADERRRLLELGFFPGTPVLCSLESPLGDPVAYTVRGMTVGLRMSQATGIAVRLLPPTDPRPERPAGAPSAAGSESTGA